MLQLLLNKNEKLTIHTVLTPTTSYTCSNRVSSPCLVSCVCCDNQPHGQ